VIIWYIFPRFGTLYQEKSGNPGEKGKSVCHLEAALKTRTKIRGKLIERDYARKIELSIHFDCLR
jgi:hypothetical protein